MAINKNHEFEDLDGVKCAIVEKNIPAERVKFLKKILEFNRYTVVVVKSPPPKAAPVTATTPAGDASPVPPTPSAPETFTIGVTDVRFNRINAVFGRSLRTPDGHIVTLAFWEQKETVSNDEVPYYEKKF
ncbi:MAG: hypothetical protein NT126_04805 [Bacteroidetes bacterium]|nr:hypothetical protein [Bacteroidota bacterium]